MAFGTSTFKHLTENAKHPRRRRRKPKPPPVPYANTPTGRKAAHEAGAYDRPTPIILHAGTEETGIDPVGAVGNTLSDALGSLSVSDPTGIYDTGAPARNLAEEEAKNLAEVAQRHYPAILGGDTGLAAIQQPADEKSIQAAGAILSPVPVGEAASAIKASEKAAQEAGAATKAVRALAGGGDGVVRKIAQKVEPDVVKAAREAAAKRASQLPAPVRTAGKVASRGVAIPVRRPLTAPLALQTPAFIASGGDPKEFVKALEGKGTFATASSSLADVATHVSPVLGEAVNLPATVLPSAFLTGKAGVNAANGDPAELDALLKQWEETGLLPALAKGDTGAALKALENHPLYSALEGSGAASVLGRGAGALARGATGDRLGGLARSDLPIRGTPINVKRRYSRDLIRQGIQRGFDQTRAGKEVRADTFRGRHFLKEAANRFEAGQEAIRKDHIHQDMQALKKTLPKKWGRIDRKSSEVVNLAVERILRHPETFNEDLPKYQAMLETAAKQLRPDGKPLLDRSQMAANKALRKQISAALKGANPEDVVKSANAFIELQAPILEEMVDLKLLTPEQAARASATSFARVHMGAGHGQPTGPITEAEAAMRDLLAQHQSSPIIRRTEAGWEGEVGGSRHHVEMAKHDLATAESGRVQAERSLATARANFNETLASRKTEKGQARVKKRLEQAEATRDAAKQRQKAAKRDYEIARRNLSDHAKEVTSRRAKERKDAESRLVEAKGAPEQILGHDGNALSLEAMQAEMQRHGVEAPGFLSHRPPANSDFYQPSFGGAMLDKGVRTGESAATGSQLGGTEALVRQLRRSRGLVDRAKGWNKAITRFGIEVPGVKTWADAKRVLKDPARYGIDPAIQPIAVPRHPFTAKENEILGALEHQDPSLAGEATSTMLHDALGEAFKGNLPDDTPIAFFPGKVAEQLREGAQPAGPGLRGAQAATTLFTRTVLPFSPGWYLGNGLDQSLRTALAGINPAHFLIGSKVKREMTKEQEAELLAGAHFSSVAALNPHRSVESLVRGYDPLSKGVRAAAEWSRRHGWKQAAVKFAPALLSHSSSYMISLNKFLTEDLPQRGALGKLALAEFRDTQGSWVRALTHQRALAEDFAKKAVDPDKMIQFQKDLEVVYGNYTRMSPAARKVLRNISPFYAWFRAAYKFVYISMPAHHPIQTAALTAAARATQPERETYGLDKQGDRPVPNFMQGGIPLPDGGIFPLSSYSSFGYASDPLEAANRLIFPQYRSIAEALAGRDWKGEELPGGEGGRVLGALWAFATAFIPGAPLLADESEGRKKLTPHINLPHPYDAGYVQYKRQPTQQITVPVGGGGGSSSGTDFGSVFSGGSSSGTDYGAVFSGGGK